MKRTLMALAVCFFAAWATALAAAPVTEDFDKGYTDGEPLRAHEGWFFDESQDTPATKKDIGVAGTWGVSTGDRGFVWTAHPLNWNDEKLVSVTVGGDWQTDAEGKLDDDRAGWSISDTSDSSDNHFGVQLDPGGKSEGGANIEAYWDGPKFGDDGGRTSIVDLPELKPNTWYRLRAKFTKLTPTSAKIEVTFVQLDESGKPTGDETKGAIDDTAKLPDTDGNKIPNPGYFAPTKVWPMWKNFRVVEGAFDNAYFEVETSGDGEKAAEPAKEKTEAEE